MNNSDVSDFLEDNFVCTYKQVSTFEVTKQRQTARQRRLEEAAADNIFGTSQPKDLENNMKLGGNVASYFCDSQGRVLEIVIGPVPANRLLVSARRSLGLHDAIKNMPREKQEETVKKAVTGLIGEENLKVFRDAIAKVEAASPESVGTIEEDLTNSARATYFASNAIRRGQVEADVANYLRILKDGSDWVDVFKHGFNTFGQSMSPDGGRSTEAVRRMNNWSEKLLFCENMALTEFPLIPLSEIEKPVFQILVGQKYSVMDDSSLVKIEQVKKALEEEKCLLAVMLDRPDDLRSNGVKVLKFKPTSRDDLVQYTGIQNQLDNYFVFEATSAELFSILSELGKPIKKEMHIRQTQQKGVGFALFDSKGNVKRLLPSGTRFTSVSSAMKRVAKNSP